MSEQVIIIGGGAAGYFAAIACAEAQPEANIVILEKGKDVLGKVNYWLEIARDNDENAEF